MRLLLLLALSLSSAAAAQAPPVPSAPPAETEPSYRSPSVALPQLIGEPWSAERVAAEVGPAVAGEIAGGGGTLRYAEDRRGATRVDLVVRDGGVYAVEIHYENSEDWLAEQWEELQGSAPEASGAAGFVSLVPFGRRYRARVFVSEGRVRLEHDAEGIRAGLAPLPPLRAPRERVNPPPVPMPMDRRSPPPPTPDPDPQEPEIYEVVEVKPNLTEVWKGSSSA